MNEQTLEYVLEYSGHISLRTILYSNETGQNYFRDVYGIPHPVRRASYLERADNKTRHGKEPVWAEGCKD